MQSSPDNSTDSILAAIAAGELVVEEIAIDVPSGFDQEWFEHGKPHRFQREAEQGDSKFENAIHPAETTDFHTFTSEAIGRIAKTRINGEWKPFKEVDIEGFLYANYLEKGDFIELLFRFSKYEFSFRGIAEEISSDGFFVVFHTEIEKTTFGETSEDRSSEYFRGYCMLTLPIRKLWLREIPFSIEKVEDPEKRLSAMSRVEIRKILKEIEDANRSVLSKEEYENLRFITERMGTFWEKHLSAIHCLIPEDSKRNMTLKVLQIKRRFASIFRKE